MFEDDKREVVDLREVQGFVYGDWSELQELLKKRASIWEVTECMRIKTPKKEGVLKISDICALKSCKNEVQLIFDLRDEISQRKNEIETVIQWGK